MCIMRDSVTLLVDDDALRDISLLALAVQDSTIDLIHFSRAPRLSDVLEVGSLIAVIVR